MSLKVTHVAQAVNIGFSNTTANNSSHIFHGLGLGTPENNLGYGLGKIVRGAFDYLTHSWQKLKTFELLTEKLAHIAQTHLTTSLQQILPFPILEKTHMKRTVQQAIVWPASFNITTLNGINGFAVPGIVAGGWLGISVSTAGDLNGDGMDDLVLGSSIVSNISDTVAAYVLFGQAGGWPASFNLTTLDGTNGFAIPAIAVDYGFGSVSTAGDLNGDGMDDLILSAPYADSEGGSEAGIAYVLFGQAGGWPAAFNLTALNGTNGFVIPGIAKDGHLGQSVRTAGDFNGDGLADLVLGAPSWISSYGAAYVLFGQATGWPASFNVTTLDGTNGFTISSNAGWLGISVSTAGDLNGDGKDDLVLGASTDSSIYQYAGAAYVLFGQASGWWSASFDLTTLNGMNGFAIPGIAAGGLLGSSVSTPGDLNGDGLADLVLGAYEISSNAGEAYVIFGQASGWPASFNLRALDGTNGFAIPGIAASDQLGESVSTAGDFNSDGLADLILGAPGVSSSSSNYTGAVYVLFGQTSGWPASFNLTKLDGSNGFTIPGIAADGVLGISVSTAGDFNGDNQVDLVLGAFGVSAQAGEAYVLFGGTSVPLVGPPLTKNQIIEIGVGVGGAVLLGGLVTLIVLLKSKKKCCFAEKAKTLSQKKTKQDEEQGLANAGEDSALYISKQDLKIEDKIAGGNFGDVYKGTWQNESVAIKQLKAQLSPDAQKKLLDEVKIMANLRSPYVVTFYGVTKEQPYKIVMQYMEGGSLRDFLKGHPPEDTLWKLRLHMSQDIGQGLKYLHNRNVVHADLKSLNVLLDGLNHAKLADFGLASVKTENVEQYYQDASQVKGSLLWMAPELLEQSHHTFATDIYSLGVVLWEIASHQLPYQEYNWGAKEMITQIIQGKRESFPKATPHDYKKLAQKCWDGDAKNRPNAEEAAMTLATLWQKQANQEDTEEEMVPIKSHQNGPSYLTGTVANPLAKTSSPTYADNAETKFGV